MPISSTSVAPGMPVRLERLGLAPAAVQREHPLRVQPLAQRVLGQQRVDLADDLMMATRGEVRIDRQLPRRQPQLLEPSDLSVGERLVGNVRERTAAEQRQRLARRARRLPASRPRASDTSRSRRQTSTSSRSIRSSYAAPARDDLRPAVAASTLRSRQT